MTFREQEILKWIEENPLISQIELAKKANITRSSVAVHISNLIKKVKLLEKDMLFKKIFHYGCRRNKYRYFS